MNRRSRRHSGAFTLVETLAAAMILALTGAMLAAAVSQGMRSLTVARNYQRAAELLNDTLTKIDLLGPARLMDEGPTEGAFAPPHHRFRWRAEIAPRTEGYLYDVVVQITWPTAGGKQRHVYGATRLNDPPKSHPEELEWDDL
ncbi:MAG: type IV pilus modification PilV family protein [Planctomycetota bacterium]|jgi:type II secretory pathway pseudopilin PulG